MCKCFFVSMFKGFCVQRAQGRVLGSDSGLRIYVSPMRENEVLNTKKMMMIIIILYNETPDERPPSGKHPLVGLLLLKPFIFPCKWSPDQAPPLFSEHMGLTFQGGLTPFTAAVSLENDPKNTNLKSLSLHLHFSIWKKNKIHQNAQYWKQKCCT